MHEIGYRIQCLVNGSLRPLVAPENPLMITQPFSRLVLVFTLLAGTFCSAEPPGLEAKAAPLSKSSQNTRNNSNKAEAPQMLEPKDGQTHFTRGTYSVTKDLTFTEPVVVDDGARFEIANGVTVSFKNRFTAGTGHLFSGAGKVAGLKQLSPEWFGAVGDGVADDTQAIQKALDCCKDNGFGLGSAGTGNVIVLTRSYLVSELVVEAAYVNIHSENAWLIAKSTGKFPYLLKIDRHFCSITGMLNIEGNYNLDYDCMINVNSRHFTAYNVIILRASLGWLFGDRKWATSGTPGAGEKGDSEIEIFGGATVHCLRGVEAVGGNTIILFNNALIYSYPWTLPDGDPRKKAWESADSTLVRSIGAFIYFTGGALANFTTKIPLVEVQPIKCTQPEYYSGYGGVFIANAHVEAGNIFATANPLKILTQDYKGNKVKQKSASLMLTNCGGYMGGDQVPINTDPLFTGDIKIVNCNFYGINRKSGYAEIGNPLTVVDIDETSFNDDRVKGLNSVVGGTRTFTQKMIFEAKKTAQTIGKDGAVVVFAVPTLTSDTGNFQSCYNATTGEFTTPVGGLRNVRISAGTYGANAKPTDTTEMMILENGKPVAITDAVGRSATIIFTIDALSAGEVITIKQGSSSGARVLSGDDFNYLQIIASRY